jgi:hypothetical protein
MHRIFLPLAAHKAERYVDSKAVLHTEMTQIKRLLRQNSEH